MQVARLGLVHGWHLICASDLAMHTAWVQNVFLPLQQGRRPACVTSAPWLPVFVYLPLPMPPRMQARALDAEKRCVDCEARLSSSERRLREGENQLADITHRCESGCLAQYSAHRQRVVAPLPPFPWHG